MVNVEKSNKEYVKRLGEEQKLARAAFGAGFLQGLSIVRAFIWKPEIKMGKNEEQAFFFGQSCGVISFWIASLVMVWIFLGG